MKSIIQLFILITSLSSLAYEEVKPVEFTWKLEGHTDALSKNDISIQSLYDLVRIKKLTKLEQLLPYLPHEHRTHFTLMHKSMSIQEASPLAPRAILFGTDARVVLSFNGDPTQKGYDALEIMEYDEQQNEFNFAELRFDEETLNHPPQINPPKCLQCHTSAPKPHGIRKPIWNQYSKWPGAYGANDDAITESLLANQETEKQALKNFFASMRSPHPRYKWLNIKKGPEMSPYENSVVGDWEFRPNLRLFELLVHRYGKSLAHYILKQQDFKIRRVAYLQDLLTLNQSKLDTTLCKPETAQTLANTSFASPADSLAANNMIFQDFETHIGLGKDAFQIGFAEDGHSSEIYSSSSIDPLLNGYLTNTIPGYYSSIAGIALRHLLDAQAFPYIPGNSYKVVTYLNIEGIPDYKNTRAYTPHFLEIDKIGSGVLDDLHLDLKSCESLYSEYILANNIHEEKLTPHPIHILNLNLANKKNPIAQCISCHTKKYGSDDTIGPYLPLNSIEGLQSINEYLRAKIPLMLNSPNYHGESKSAARGDIVMPYGRKALSEDEINILKHQLGITTP